MTGPGEGEGGGGAVDDLLRDLCGRGRGLRWVGFAPIRA